jgi:hypothetical protein
MLRIDDVEFAVKEIHLMAIMMKTFGENLRTDQRSAVPL